MHVWFTSSNPFVLAGTENTARHTCYNFDTLVDIFMEMVDVLVMEISTVLLKFEGRKLHFSAKSSSHIRVMELVEEVNHFWNRCSLSIQEVVTNTLSSNHLHALQVLHKFLFKAMRGNIYFIAMKDAKVVIVMMIYSSDCYS